MIPYKEHLSIIDIKLLYYLHIKHRQLFINWWNSFPLMAIKTLIQTPHQWLYNLIIEIIAIRYIIYRNVGKCYKNIKNTSHNHCQCLLLYKLAEQSTSGLGRFLECRKCNILVITQALVLCLIYMHSPSGAACPPASCIYIR